MLGRALVAAFVLLSSSMIACLGPEATWCGFDLICPAGMACDSAHGRCVFPAQLTACDDLEEGVTCTFSGAPTGMYRCQDGVCLLAERCGDGILNGVEQCDGTDLGDSNCEEFSYYGGTLGCTEICSYDLSGCEGRCGNGLVEDVEADEVCDGTNLNGETCVSLGMDSGDLGCNADCTFDLRTCVGCGNGIMETGEQCDGTDLAGLTCLQITGHPDGELQCTAECQLLTTGCHTCGNATLEGPEVCDSSNLGGETCQSQAGLAEGALACSPDCLSFDPTDCHLCGNQVIEGPEACDTDNLGGATCNTLVGLQQGQPTCNPNCTFNIADCHTCGNQVVEGPEACDDTNLAGATCDSLTGLIQGVAVCSAGCTYDTSDCHTCGNGTTEGPETCDDGNSILHDSCPDGLQGTCQPATCGDGFAWIEDGGAEQCDTVDLVSQTCQDHGYVAASGLTCAANCLFDTAGCTAVCGNGIIEPGEQCDASALNGVSPEPCKSDCTLTLCGDGYLGGIEQCDAGAQNGQSPESCMADCTLTVCGDGYLGGTEECDGSDLGAHTCVDLGYVDPIGLACTPGCQFDISACTAVCGNGVAEPTEECDDGNNVSGDGCSANCLSDETCGNSILDVAAGEACDDGNLVDGDGCDSSCQLDCILNCTGYSCGQTEPTCGTTCGDPCDPGCTGHCSNGFQDCDETRVDCGGSTCSGCGCGTTCYYHDGSCSSSYIGACDGCDMGCEVHDPDCDDPGSTCLSDCPCLWGYSYWYCDGFDDCADPSCECSGE